MTVKSERIPNSLLRAVSESGKTPTELIEAALAASPSMTYAAASLGVSESALYKWRRRYGLKSAPVSDETSSC